LQPQATIVHYQLALAYRRLGDMETARAHLEQRGDKQLGFADPLLGAIEPLKRENIVEAVLEMAANPEEHDDRSFGLFAASYLADSPGAVDRIHEAIEALTGAAAGMDSSPELAARNRLVRARLHFVVASLHIGQGDFGAARREVEASLALVPEMVVANAMLGYVLEQTGNLSEAVERYSIALELDPGNINALRSGSAIWVSKAKGRGSASRSPTSASASSRRHAATTERPSI